MFNYVFHFSNSKHCKLLKITNNQVTRAQSIGGSPFYVLAVNPFVHNDWFCLPPSNSD